MLIPAQMIRLALATNPMLAEAQLLVGMRMLGMAGRWRLHPSETACMSSEKVSASREMRLSGPGEYTD